MRSLRLQIQAAGAVTSVGFNAPATFAAVRAGIDSIAEQNLWDDENQEYLPGAKVHLPQWWEGRGKLADLVAPAIKECLQAAAPLSPHDIPIVLGVAPPCRPFRYDGLEDKLIFEVEQKLGLGHHKSSRVLNSGRISAIAGLHYASEVISGRLAPACIIAGVDSFVDQDLVRIYRERRRILTSSNSNGFIPGEAGCAVLVTPSQGLSGELTVRGLGFGQEKGTIESDEPLTGDGATNALRDALKSAGVEMAQTDYWLTDQNGEHYRVKECTIAQIRLERRYKPPSEPYKILHPIEYVGDIGAAIGAFLMGQALFGAKLGYAPGPLALLHTGEDDGNRAAAVLGWSDEDETV